jgi:hypothetical protein
MQRTVVVWLALTFALAGCISASDDIDPDTTPCATEPVAQTYWLSQGLALRPSEPTFAGRTDGNGASNAFVADDSDEWRSSAFTEGIRIIGEVKLDLYAESKGAVAPYTHPDDSTQGWQFFTQFGSDRGFAGTYHNVYGDAFSPPGTVTHYEQSFMMPEGGHVVESGDQLRLLLTSLAADSGDGGSHTILWGGETPSRLTFEAVCYLDRSWELLNVESEPIALTGNQGLLTGAVEEREGVNVQNVTFTLLRNTERLTIQLQETNKNDGTKDDMDLVIENASGPVVGIGSPYADEIGTFWRANLAAFLPPGDYTVSVHSYSGTNYEGTLTITQEHSA